jgi:hypothetical protein
MAAIPRSFHLRKTPEVWQEYYQRCNRAGLTGAHAVSMFVDDVVAGRIELDPAGIRLAEDSPSDLLVEQDGPAER